MVILPYLRSCSFIMYWNNCIICLTVGFIVMTHCVLRLHQVRFTVILCIVVSVCSSVMYWMCCVCMCVCMCYIMTLCCVCVFPDVLCMYVCLISCAVYVCMPYIMCCVCMCFSRCTVYNTYMYALYHVLCTYMYVLH